MAPAATAPEPPAVVLRRWGDPFEAEAAEERPPAARPSHVAVLHRLFYASTVDIGAVVRIESETYICTRVGWRSWAGPP